MQHHNDAHIRQEDFSLGKGKPKGSHLTENGLRFIEDSSVEGGHGETHGEYHTHRRHETTPGATFLPDVLEKVLVSVRVGHPTEGALARLTANLATGHHLLRLTLVVHVTGRTVTDVKHSRLTASLLLADCTDTPVDTRFASL